jgi:hypothetical protein
MVIAQFAFARTVYLFAHRPLSVVALEYASTLQFRNDQVHEIDKAFRAYWPILPLGRFGTLVAKHLAKFATTGIVKTEIEGVCHGRFRVQ